MGPKAQPGDEVGRAVAGIGRAMNRLIDLLRSPDDAVWPRAGAALGAIDPPAVWASVDAALGSGDPVFQLRAIAVLQGFAPGARPHALVVLTAFLRANTAAEVRWAVLNAALATGKPAAELGEGVGPGPVPGNADGTAPSTGSPVWPPEGGGRSAADGSRGTTPGATTVKPSELPAIRRSCPRRPSTPQGNGPIPGGRVGDAPAADPKLADGREVCHCFSAACAAGLAGLGKPKDNPPPDAGARERLRGEDLGWLNAKLLV